MIDTIVLIIVASVAVYIGAIVAISRYQAKTGHSERQPMRRQCPPPRFGGPAL